ncbi:hypothetical protein [Microbacterium sp. zg.Y909]|uniref:hypothetical protein n=1 Tax=Microbacterium sp. zg.Y909 TaxID=2969413 RepID=UPI00214ADD71|nr:hypothetical protein [Microbacterium sp. zg.Y909]MCR2824432.1 hypothetical protein [Microbacterium sp. zg.Y909]
MSFFRPATPMDFAKRATVWQYGELMNVFDPNRFWPNGDADSREWRYMEGADRDDWREACREAYKRNSREYAEPSGILLLVSQEEASGAPIYEAGARNGLAPTWDAVRGTDYVAAAKWDIAAGEARAIIVDLVPTPDNPHDPTAVAVEYQGIKLGNLSRGYAAYSHWIFRQLNYRGLRVRTAAVYRAFYRPEIRLATPEAFVALPPLPGLARYMPSMDEQSLGFRRLWDALDASLQDEIRADWYHLSEEVAPKLIRYASAFPELTLPTQASSDMPKAFDVAMQTVRLEEAAAREAEREAAKALERETIKVLVTERLTRQEIAERMQIPRGRVDRIVKELGIAADVEIRQPFRISDERKREILERATRGESNAQIEREMKLGQGRAAKVLSENGISRGPARGGLSDFHRASMKRRLDAANEALGLQDAGLTRNEISIRLGVGSSTTKTYLADARFFAAPEDNTMRLEHAAAARHRQLTGGQARNAAERRGIADANILDVVKPGWI